jgi:hypothetical protein
MAEAMIAVNPIESEIGGERPIAALSRDNAVARLPRNQWHTFWNAGDHPARILEIISPAGFEKFFRELIDLGGVTSVAPQTLGSLCDRYGLEMDPGSAQGLAARFGLRFPGA